MPSPTRSAARTLVDALAVKLGSGLCMGVTALLFSRLHLGAVGPALAWGLRVAGVLGLVHLVLRRWGKYTDLELGLKASPATLRQAAGGALGGLLVATLAAALPVGLGALEVTRVSSPDALALALGLVAVVGAALFEELTYRTGVTAVLAGRFGRPVAVVVSGLVFAAGHLHHKPVSADGLANVFLAGVWFALLFLDRGNRPSSPGLGWATGAHAGWNVTVLMLGLDDSTTLRFFAASAQDSFWTGGPNGFEAGFATTLALLGAIAALLARPRPRPLTAAQLTPSQTGPQSSSQSVQETP